MVFWVFFTIYISGMYRSWGKIVIMTDTALISTLVKSQNPVIYIWYIFHKWAQGDLTGNWASNITVSSITSLSCLPDFSTFQLVLGTLLLLLNFVLGTEPFPFSFPLWQVGQHLFLFHADLYISLQAKELKLVLCKNIKNVKSEESQGKEYWTWNQIT